VKILLCHNYYQQPGGESEAFDNEVRGLKQMGEHVILFCRQNAEIEAFSSVEKLRLFFSAYYSDQTYNALDGLIRDERPDAAIVQNVFPLVSPSIYVALADRRIPTIQAVYNYRFVCPSGELYTQGAICERCVAGNTVHAVIHKCYRRSYAQSAWYASIIGGHRWLGTFERRISSFMVPDQFLGVKLAEGGIPAAKIWRNPNPFFPEDYEPSQSHEGYVLFVGRLSRRKGILTLLDAMARTQTPRRLKIVGQGDLVQELKAAINARDLSGRVTFLGARWGAELATLIRDCAAAVIPSEWYDSLPMVLCKANALGKPVIASRIDGMPEYVIDGVNGYLFEPGDASQLAAFIDLILGMTQEEYARFSRSARKMADDLFAYSGHYRALIEHLEAPRAGSGP
jgi:glycosyltransferase involved in cell wall biosynthesis